MTRPPPVPPQNQSPKGTGDPKSGSGNQEQKTPSVPARDSAKGQQANIKQNTTNQGYQQDR